MVSPAVLGQLKSLQTQFEGINAKVKTKHTKQTCIQP